MSNATPRVVVLVVLGPFALLGLALLAASTLPDANLAAHLLGAVGDVRTGPYTQDLIAHLGERLRFGGVLLLLLTAVLVAARARFEHLVGSLLSDVRLSRWPDKVDTLALVVPLCLAVGLRLAFLNQPMRYDEALTFNE